MRASMSSGPVHPQCFCSLNAPKPLMSAAGLLGITLPDILVAPPPTNTYTDSILPNAARFYRLQLQP